MYVTSEEKNCLHKGQVLLKPMNDVRKSFFKRSDEKINFENTKNIFLVKTILAYCLVDWNPEHIKMTTYINIVKLNKTHDI